MIKLLVYLLLLVQFFNPLYNTFNYSICSEKNRNTCFFTFFPLLVIYLSLWNKQSTLIYLFTGTYFIGIKINSAYRFISNYYLIYMRVLVQCFQQIQYSKYWIWKTKYYLTYKRMLEIKCNITINMYFFIEYLYF